MKNLKRAFAAIMGAGAALVAFTGVSSAAENNITTAAVDSPDCLKEGGGLPGADCHYNDISKSQKGIDLFRGGDSRDPSDRVLKADEVAIDWARC
ncbi:hypothetical protein [Streptomyces luteireticuli]|uniref:hypothetical protein n=1 Tax=Streptomyces luteireticuli TaxID=173858 RepID=UPI003558A62E